MRGMVRYSLFLAAATAMAATLEVGPGKSFARPCDAIRAASIGDVIEIASGNYDGDVCTITRAGLTIRGVGPSRPHLRAMGRAADGKGIWVAAPTANNLTVEGIEFSGARVPDLNGAGIRVDPGASVTIRDCHFHDNETGVLTGNGGTITIEYSIFENNGAGDGQSHNVYVNFADRFVFRGNYSARSRVGQLVKSRAKESYILYNRLSQENGTGSREIDLSNGGLAFVIGNIIQQTGTTQNSNLLGFQPEGPSPEVPLNELFVVNNTFVNQHSTGEFIQIGARVAAPAVIRNNIFFGPGTVSNQPTAVLDRNFRGDPGFTSVINLDLTLRPGSPASDSGATPGTGPGAVSLTPTHHYSHPACNVARPMVGVIDAGAYEYGGDPGQPAGPARCTSTLAPYSIVHGATFERGPLAPGSIATLFGRNLTDSTIIPSGTPLPVLLQGIRVNVNALSAPLFFVAPEQINFQVPYGLGFGDGVVQMEVNGQARPAVRIRIEESAPGIFLHSGTQAVAQNQDFTLNEPENPARPGSVIVVYLTGQGTLSTFLRAGEPARANPLAESVLPRAATLGGREADVLFLGMTPGLIGVAQANIRIPAGVGAGSQPLRLRIGAADSNAALVAVAE